MQTTESAADKYHLRPSKHRYGKVIAHRVDTSALQVLLLLLLLLIIGRVRPVPVYKYVYPCEYIQGTSLCEELDILTYHRGQAILGRLE